MKTLTFLEFWNAIDRFVRIIISAGNPSIIIELLNGLTLETLIEGGKGNRWENYMESLLRERGHQVVNVAKQQLPYDLIVDGKLRVQCKFGNHRGVLQPTRNPTMAKGFRRYHSSDFDVAAIAYQSMDTMLFIPVKALTRSDGYLITYLRDCDFDWKDRWDVFEASAENKCFYSMELFDRNSN